MRWACFLHIYQPPNQSIEVLERVVNESYRPIFRGLKNIRKAKINLNINAVLTEQLYERGFRDVVDSILNLVKDGRIELTGSCKYHAFIPLIPKEEAIRQAMLNYETNAKYFGDWYNPKGFFSPEMSYSPKVAEVAEELGYKWILADEIAYNGILDTVSFNKLYKIAGFDVNVYFREKRTSNLIMGAIVRDSNKLIDLISKDEGGRYLLTAMDGETFGHHRIGLDKTLLEVLSDPKIETVKISDLESFYGGIEEVVPKDSTWASSERDIAEGNPFNLWFDRGNEIHLKEWELTDIAIRVVGDSEYKKVEGRSLKIDREEEGISKWKYARSLLDQALHSCHYWWASANPWWSIEMIEEGVFSLWQSVINVPDASDVDKDRAEELYFEILLTAHSWQRTGLVSEKTARSYAWKKIPFKDRAKSGEYEALLELLKEEELKSSSSKEYEQAIKWRDAQMKLEKGFDVYDSVHVIDQLMGFVDFKRYEDLVEKYRKEYRYINSGQPEK